jgi:hypothetical protein
MLCGAGHKLRLTLSHIWVLVFALIVLTRFASKSFGSGQKVITAMLDASVRLPYTTRQR